MSNPVFRLSRSTLTIPTILNLATFSPARTRQLHAHIIKSGLLNDNSLSSKLLSLYSNHRCFAEASIFLDSIDEPSSSSFSIIINALSKFNFFNNVVDLFRKMLSKGVCLDSYLLPAVSKACAGLSAFELGRQVHGLAQVSGCSLDVVVQSSLVHMYVKCGRLSIARKVLDEIPEPDVVTFSAMIAGYARNGDVGMAKRLFGDMGKLGLEPNLVSWNGLIAGFNQSGRHLEAIHVFLDMHLRGCQPDGSSFSSVLAAIADLEVLNVGIQVHGYVIKRGFACDKWVVSSLVDMYGKYACVSEMKQVFDEMGCMEIGSCNALVSALARNGLVNDALAMFSQMRERKMDLNVVSWTSMISCCSQNGKDVEALELFTAMQLAGVKPNAVTIPCLLPACGNIAALMHGKAAHCFSIRRQITNDVFVGSALIDMYAKCGKIRDSQLCFDAMPTRNTVSWNAVIGGYAMHGKDKEALEMFDLMLKSGQKPNFITFTCLLSACNQKGLVDEGWRYFNCMQKEHGVEAKMEHYACMVSLLSRVGKLEEAYSVIKEMPFEPDACVWGALLSSCRTNKNLKLGEIAAERLFKLEPRNPGNYVLLSNIYASKGMWGDVDRVRDLMKDMGLKKNPGCSWIEIKNKVHMLLAGDRTHPQMSQIIHKMEALGKEMRKAGLDPKIDYVLQDVEEQDKEQMLCGHSEKLAVAFGLLNTPAGFPLRVIKNLRICGDCHAVIKFISSIERREIFVRDTNRFHHFKDGECSCGDHW
ncbi:pentatricopeptide repeat-containing protein At1g20230-like [Chenopodium quinoa]|nr:pentatricopeptide repeat-containing protein At1g20230-like [Chenopodium quinoa]